MIKHFKFFEGEATKQRVFTDMMVYRIPQTHFFHGPTQHLGFYVGAQNTQLELIYDGDMDELSVRAMIDELKYRYRNYICNEQVIGFMEDFLNEHLDGTSTIRYI